MNPSADLPAHEAAPLSVPEAIRRLATRRFAWARDVPDNRLEL